MNTSHMIDLRRTIQSAGGSDVRYYIQVTWQGGVPVNVKKYTDIACTHLSHDVDIIWANGVPVSVSDHDVINNTTQIKNITWANGVPVSIV